MKPTEDLMDAAKELDKAYIPTRYPNAHPQGAPYEYYTKKEAERLIEYAEKSSSTVKVYYPRYRRDELIQYLKHRVGLLAQRIPLKLVMLFGSYAEGRYTAASDIDLLVVYEGRKRDDIYKIVWDTIALPNLQPHIYTADEWNMLRPRAWKGVVIYQLDAP
jgi:hypothetical protein